MKMFVEPEATLTMFTVEDPIATSNGRLWPEDYIPGPDETPLF